MHSAVPLPTDQRRRRVPLVLALCGALVAARAEPVAADAVPAHLVIASEGARPPYNYMDGDKLAGFEIDLGHDLCRRLTTRCTFVTQDWDTMIPALLAHRFDAIMAAMEINPDREARIAFSVPYVRMPSSFLVRRNDAAKAVTPDAFAGRAIGFEGGGTHQFFLEKTYPRSRLRRYPSLNDAILDLEAGRVDAALGDKDAVVAFMETRGDASCCRIAGDVSRIPAFFGAGIGIGLRKEDVALRAAFDAALAACVADGTFERIRARYFDFPLH